VPNDCGLGTKETLALITGPNMAGKSTYIRTAALLTILAHTGSFLPAASARIGLTDRVFTRLGADDALHAGQSTFMVEMIETARILLHATPRSLVVLDEVGRGTSTLDGLSLAWAIAEHLSAPVGGERGPRALFATHYHELTVLAERLPGKVKNLHVLVREWPGEGGQGEIVFLHRVAEGSTDQSYGVHVARLAGMPEGVVARAREVLAGLAVQQAGAVTPNAARERGMKVPEREPAQLGLFREYIPHPAVDALREVKLEAITPLGAFDVLRTIKAMAEAAEQRASASDRP
jgi:DNA mismatch repair protein MutS